MVGKIIGQLLDINAINRNRIGRKICIFFANGISNSIHCGRGTQVGMLAHINIRIKQQLESNWTPHFLRIVEKICQVVEFHLFGSVACFVVYNAEIAVTVDIQTVEFAANPNFFG